MNKRPIVLVLAAAVLLVLLLSGTALAYTGGKTAEPFITSNNTVYANDAYAFVVYWDTDTGGKPVKYALEYSTVSSSGPWITEASGKLAPDQIKRGALQTNGVTWTGMRYWRLSVITRSGLSDSAVWQITPGD